MKKSPRVAAVAVVVGAVGRRPRRALRRDSGRAAMPTAVVAKTTFVDFLQLRGEIRPVQSVVLTAPVERQRPADRRPREERREGERRRRRRRIRSDAAAAHARDQAVGAEAGRVGDRADRSRAAPARAVGAERARRSEEGACSARGSTCRATSCARASRPRTSSSTLSNADEHVRELEKKVEGERIAAAADVAIARQKRDKALFDVQDTERILGSLHGTRADWPDRSRCCRTSAPAAPDRARAGVQARRPRLVRRGDRRAARSLGRADDRARRRSRSRRACRPAARSACASTRFPTAS